jgi:hypothetical protein
LAGAFSRGNSPKKGLAKPVEGTKWSASGVPALFVGTPLRVSKSQVIGTHSF